MKLTASLFLSCVLLMIASSESQIILSKIHGGIKKIASDIGIIKTTQPSNSVNKVEQPRPTTPLASKVETYAPTDKPNEKNHPSVLPPQNDFQSNVKPSAVSDDKKIDLVDNVDATHKPGKTPAEVNLGSFPPRPSGFTKNNVTSISKDGSVVFPEEEHDANATKVSTDALECDPKKAYTQGHVCAKVLGVRENCQGAVSEDNKCRPTVL